MSSACKHRNQGEMETIVGKPYGMLGIHHETFLNVVIEKGMKPISWKDGLDWRGSRESTYAVPLP